MPLTWAQGDRGAHAMREDGKGRVLLDTLLAKGFEVIPPKVDQLQQPTSKPKKEGAVGRRIDWLACKRAVVSQTTIFTDSNRHLGTDHDALGVLKVAKAPAQARVRLGTRVVKSPIKLGRPIDQNELERLAQLTTHVPQKE